MSDEARALGRGGGGGSRGAITAAPPVATLVTPSWERGANPAVGGRLQATLRFDPPGVSASDRLLMVTPDGDQLPLLLPDGLHHVRRITVSMALSPRAARETAFEADVVPVPSGAKPGDVLTFGHVPVWLPDYATPGSCLVVALPLAPSARLVTPASATASLLGGAPRRPRTHRRTTSGFSEVSAYEVSQTASLAGDDWDCDVDEPLESSLDQSGELRWEVSGAGARMADR